MGNFISDLLGFGQRLVTVNPQDTAGPETPSSDYLTMAPQWQMIAHILAGGEAVRRAGERYLPKYEKESANEYKRRLKVAPWRPEFVDALRNLTSRPFTRPPVLSANSPPQIALFADDVDGCGNALSIFAKQLFTGSVARGLGAILVDYPITPNLIDGKPVTLADERKANRRPYWVYIKAENILALSTEHENGRERITHVRIRECSTKREGFREHDVERVRVMELDPSGKPVWQLWERTAKGPYEVIQSGEFSLPEIPLALLFIGDREGGYRVKPPLIELADMQMELYRSLSRQDEILTYAGSPMLVGKGMSAPDPTPRAGEASVSQMTIGPKTVLFAPAGMDGAQADWHYIAPDAATIAEVGKNPQAIVDDIRRLGMQPTQPRSGNMTATGSAIDASKAHSAVQAWAVLLEDTLNQALKFTAQWLNVADLATVSIHTDFVGDSGSTDEAKVLGAAQARQVISKKTEREELQRRGILGPQFDADAEDQQIAEETLGLDPEVQIDPVTGMPINNRAAA